MFWERVRIVFESLVRRERLEFFGRAGLFVIRFDMNKGVVLFWWVYGLLTGLFMRVCLFRLKRFWGRLWFLGRVGFFVCVFFLITDLIGFLFGFFSYFYRIIWEWFEGVYFRVYGVRSLRWLFN